MCDTRCPRARDSLRNCLTTSVSTCRSSWGVEAVRDHEARVVQGVAWAVGMARGVGNSRGLETTAEISRGWALAGRPWRWPRHHLLQNCVVPALRPPR